MNKEDRLNRVLAGLSHTGYTTEIEKCEARLFIEYLDKENQKYKEVIDKLQEWINIVQQNKDNKHLEPFISTDELDELLDILKEVE